jgi:hypothetical protein
MTPIAAYYVMVLTDHERESAKTTFRTAVPKASRAERIARSLETLIRLGRPATTQPV